MSHRHRLRFTVQQALLQEAAQCFAAFSRVYWIVGAACAGKSAVCRELAAMRNLELVDMDTLIYGTFMGRYTPARHPANTAWFGAPDPFAWVMDLTWEEFNALTAAADAEYLDLFARELSARDPARPLLVDGGVAHPAVPAQVMPAARIGCVAVRDEIRTKCWETAEDRADLRRWVNELPDPIGAWEKFLHHDRLMAQTMDAECAAHGIVRIERRDDEDVTVTATRMAHALGI